MSKLLATYGLQDSDARLIIEQQEYAAYTGRVTKFSMARILAKMIYGLDYENFVDCGVDGSAIATRLDVYPDPVDLPFAMHVSRGTLGDGSPERVQRTELVNFRLGTPALKYPCVSIDEVSWLGNVYDANFNRLGEPGVTLVDGALRTTVPVYGSARITYTTVCASYPLTIEGREDSVENKYSSVAYGVHRGGVDWLVLQPPEGVEETDGDCLFGGSNVTIDPGDDPEDEPTANGSNVHLVLDYCTKETISDSRN